MFLGIRTSYSCHELFDGLNNSENNRKVIHYLLHKYTYFTVINVYMTDFVQFVIKGCFFSPISIVCDISAYATCSSCVTYKTKKMT